MSPAASAWKTSPIRGCCHVSTFFVKNLWLQLCIFKMHNCNHRCRNLTFGKSRVPNLSTGVCVIRERIRILSSRFLREQSAGGCSPTRSGCGREVWSCSVQTADWSISSISGTENRRSGEWISEGTWDFGAAEDFLWEVEACSWMPAITRYSVYQVFH